MGENSKKLIVYYSRSGKTKIVANKLADLLNADCEEIVDLTKRKGLIGFFKGAHSALKQKYTKIMAPKYNPDHYDLVVLCSPMWAGNITPAIRTYCQQYSLPKVAWVITCSDSKNDIQHYPTGRNTIIATAKFGQKDINSNNIDQPLKEFIAKL